MHGALKALRAHVLNSSTPHPRPLTSGVERSLLKQRQEQRNRCSLIYKCPFLGCQAHPPAIQASASPSKPVRPRVVARAALPRPEPDAAGVWLGAQARALLLLSKSDPLALGSDLVGERGIFRGGKPAAKNGFEFVKINCKDQVLASLTTMVLGRSLARKR